MQNWPFQGTASQDSGESTSRMFRLVLNTPSRTRSTNTYLLAYAMNLQAWVWYGQHRFNEARSEALRALNVFKRPGVARNAEALADRCPKSWTTRSKNRTTMVSCECTQLLRIHDPFVINHLSRPFTQPPAEPLKITTVPHTTLLPALRAQPLPRLPLLILLSSISVILPLVVGLHVDSSPNPFEYVYLMAFRNIRVVA